MRTFTYLFLVLLASFAAIAAAVALNGWVLSILWGWFVVPHGLPVLSALEAMGIALVVAFLTQSSHFYKDHKPDSTATLCYAFGRPLFVLFVGYVLKLFMLSAA